MAEPTFRRAEQGDAPTVAEVGGRIWDEMGVSSGFQQKPTAEEVAAILSRENSAVFVCEAETGICGFSVLQRDETDPEEAVMGVWLLPEARRRGIGRELALMATDFARSAGYNRLRGIIPRDNEPALSFFSEIASLARVVGQGMEYELPL
jgi:ribosomal protein S18 acetylase RimI-like enzyme